MEPLKKLKLTTSKSVKDKHYEQIQARLSKDAPPKAAILPNIISVAVVLLVLFLAIAAPTTDVTTDTGITKLYMNERGAPSHSKWFVGVKETTDPEQLEAVSDILRTLKPIDEVPYGHDIYYTFTVFNADGYKSYGLLTYGTYLMDLETHQFYTFEGDDEFGNQLDTLMIDISVEQYRWWTIFLLFGWLLVKAIVDKCYYPRDVDGHKLPRFSSRWQSIVWVLTLITIIPMFYLPFLFHYGLIFAIITCSVLLQIWLETRADNATWRKWMFLDHYWILVVVFALLGSN